MRNFLMHMGKNYSDKISAYVLAGGGTSEWYDRSDLAESPSRIKAWTKELESQDLPPTDIPGMLARDHVSFDGLLRDPQIDDASLRYIKFCAAQISDHPAPLLVVAENIKSAEILFNDLNAWTGGKILYFPELELKPYEWRLPFGRILEQRISTMDRLIRDPGHTVITTRKALMQKLRKPEKLKREN